MPSSSDARHADEVRDLPAGTVVAGRFRVERVVGRGGFGCVYYCTQLPIERPVALKVLHQEQSGAAGLESFLREARTVARLSHPNIVQLHDFGVLSAPDGDLPWMALEWLDGATLQRVLRARRGVSRYTPAECLELVRPLLEAIAFTHEQGVVHRDIKPGNVILARGPNGTVLKVLDFGIAKSDETYGNPSSGVTETRSTVSAFSLNYCAPEQLLRARTGPWTDVHALGLIVTEMLTAERPYATSENQEVEYRIVSADRPTPARRGVDVGAWEPVLARALALQSSARYANARAFLKALEESVSQATLVVREEEATVRPALPASGELAAERRKVLAQSAAAIEPPGETRTATPHDADTREDPPREGRPARRRTPLRFIVLGALAVAVGSGTLIGVLASRQSSAPAARLDAPARPSPVQPAANPAPAPTEVAPGTVVTAAPPAATPPSAAPSRPAHSLAETSQPRTRARPRVGRAVRGSAPARRTTGEDTYVPPE